MRRAGLWVVAVCVGFVAVWAVQTAVGLRWGTVSGGAAGLYSVGLVVIFGFTTAWVVTWLESISRPARGFAVEAARALETGSMFDDVLEANRRFQAGFKDTGLQGKAVKGLAVVTCIDSRIDPLGMLGLQPGDAKIIRNAGARVTDDALRSLILAANLLDVTRVALVQHTECAVVGTSETEMRKNVEAAAGTSAEGWDFGADADQVATLKADLEKIRSCPLLPDDLEVAGFVFDVRTGALTPAG